MKPKQFGQFSQSEKANNKNYRFFICDLTRYDIDNSGAIDKQEMLKVMKSIYAMVSL